VKVLFDEQVFLLQRYGGVSRYFVEIIKQFVKDPELGIEPILCLKRTSNVHLLRLSNELELGVLPSASNKIIALAIAAKSAQFNLPKVDLIHHTFYSKLFWRPRFNGPRICTHYDMIPELFNETRLGINPHLSKKWYYENVDQILSISNSAKEDLNNVWPDINTPIEITHLGNPNKDALLAPRRRGHVIYVGNRRGYKDAETLLRAFSQVPDSLRTKLEFLGGGEFSPTELDLIAELGISNYVTQKDVTDKELESAYSSAHVFIFPSRYEGFGLPVLEALQFGCRSILSDTPALIEIGGDCATYFKAGNVQSLTHVMKLVLAENPDFNPYLKSGLLRVNEFSWRKTATLTAGVYHKLVY
jgi:glycosyltransferase involved in cell wall biosynthesis